MNVRNMTEDACLFCHSCGRSHTHCCKHCGGNTRESLLFFPSLSPCTSLGS
ncbi:hypothetical protein E2C01_058921 [Portunus trituberculatus]|uniref:Uncharacterized protein n=1 Tax=Portunus trituberculatus TaxID=210409 RepID=A0A5B7GXN6_PORTR|nr:hypothetical protein [Portunus trituberculatus]